MMHLANCRYFPETVNVELTTHCPLRCPQCYCSLTGGKNIDVDTAIYWIREAASVGVKDVMLSGGETLCYPHLFEVIRVAKECCGSVNVALSGYHFTQNIYERLVEAGVTGIYISLNGSTEEINSLTRDGYDLAISALKLLQKNKFAYATINWVMHSCNADDFINVVNLAEQYGVAEVVVIGVKPDSKHTLNTIPTKEQMYSVRDDIRNHRGSTKIYIESCFSPLLALASDTTLFGNLNVGKNNGCCAGRTTFSVSVDGLLSPCRHLEYYERFSTIAEYWEKSEILRELRGLGDDQREKCDSCRLHSYCRPCVATYSKLEHQISRGGKYCPISPTL